MEDFQSSDSDSYEKKPSSKSSRRLVHNSTVELPIQDNKRVKTKHISRGSTVEMSPPKIFP